MTTIAYRDGKLAGDSRAYGGDKAPFGQKTKIHRLDDGTLFGASSNSVGADGLVRRWIEAGCPPPESSTLMPETFEVLLVRPSGDLFFARNNLELSGPIRAPFVAIGSGNQYALGAMSMGATAAQAVEAAIDLDVWTGGEITVLSLD